MALMVIEVATCDDGQGSTYMEKKKEKNKIGSRQRYMQ